MDTHTDTCTGLLLRVNRAPVIFPPVAPLPQRVIWENSSKASYGEPHCGAAEQFGFLNSFLGCIWGSCWVSPGAGSRVMALGAPLVFAFVFILEPFCCESQRDRRVGPAGHQWPRRTKPCCCCCCHHRGCKFSSLARPPPERSGASEGSGPVPSWPAGRTAAEKGNVLLVTQSQREVALAAGSRIPEERPGTFPSSLSVCRDSVVQEAQAHRPESARFLERTKGLG